MPAFSETEPTRRVGTAVRWSVLAVACALAALSFRQTAATVPQFANFAPDYALKLKLSQIDRKIVSHLANKPLSPIAGSLGAADAALLVERWTEEPLSARPLAEVALSSTIASDAARDTLVQAALSLTRRDELVQGLWIKRLAEQGDPASSFRWIEQLTASNPNAAARTVRPMVAGLAVDGWDELLYEAMAERPSWSRAFWEMLVSSDFNRNALVIERGADLRIRLAGMPAGQAAFGWTETSLATALADTGQHEKAFTLANTLLRANGRQPIAFDAAAKRGNMVQDPNFKNIKGIAPFAWVIYPSEGWSASVDEEIGGLIISPFSGSGGLIGRQLVALQPGKVVVTAALEAPVAASGERIGLSLDCATSGISPLGRPLKLNRPNQRAEGMVANCRWHWLSLRLDTGPARPLDLLNIRGISVIGT